MWWTKWHWSGWSQSSSVSPASPESTNCSTLLYQHRPRAVTVVADVPIGLGLTLPRELHINLCNHKKLKKHPCVT
jgi:hypothetical protein